VKTKSDTGIAAFTLLELLTVIAIIGILAAVAVPTLGKFKPNFTASASRQLLDDLARARQLAISERTTVYMVFVPTNFWSDPAYGKLTANPPELAKADKLLDKQFIGYNFVSLRSLGDQPGRPTVRYLSTWKTLPDGVFIPREKFGLYNNAVPPVPVMMLTNAPYGASNIYGFHRTASVPFPSEDAVTNTFRANQLYVTLPYVAFDYMGRLASGTDEVIPLAKGSIGVPRGSDRKAVQGPVSFTEQPIGNATNSFNLIYVSWLTGRARAVQQEVQ
jgi:prepilin-type N-terminal cleavage/methylation domain-containing protein